MHNCYVIDRPIEDYVSLYLVFLSRNLRHLVASKDTYTSKIVYSKSWQIYRQYLDEFLATLAGDLRCNICDVLVKCDKNFFAKVREKVIITKLDCRGKADPKINKSFHSQIN